MKNKILLSLLGAFIFSSLILDAQPSVKKESFYSYNNKGEISGYIFPELRYSYSALEPAIDSVTMRIHYDKHHRAYFAKFAAQVKDLKLAAVPLEDLFKVIDTLPEGIRNNGGGYYNHVLYWDNMSPDGKDTHPDTRLENALNQTFGTFTVFKETFANMAKAKFGSGWVWLILNASNQLEIVTTSNQDNPLMSVSEKKGIPLLALDVWEHAYYLKYQNKRADYIDAFWNVVNWNEVNKRYRDALMKQSSSVK